MLVAPFVACGGNVDHTGSGGGAADSSSTAGAGAAGASASSGAAGSGAAATDPGKVGCGSETCGVPAQVCCEQPGPGSEACASGTSCGDNGNAGEIHCDEPADCPVGQKCCGTIGLNSALDASCAPTCGEGTFQRCKTSADCAGESCASKHCVSHTLPICGAGPFYCE